MYKVLTVGTFDLFHAGHVNLLLMCKKIAGPNGELIVGLNNDEFVFRFKHKKPVISFDNRKKVLESCRYVDRVVENFGNEDSKKLIINIQPNFLVIGSDWAKKDYYTQMGFTQEWLDRHNFTLIYVPYTEGISSTIIKGEMRCEF